jgi:hypothetical protein
LADELADYEERIRGWVNRRAPHLWGKYPDARPIDVVMLELDARMPRNVAGHDPARRYPPNTAHVPNVKPGSPEARKLMGGDDG